MMYFDLADEEATIAFARQLAGYCTLLPLTITLKGPLGAGKTTLIRALLKELGVTGTIKSPTFSLVESYQNKELHFHHFDLYRIEREEELEDLGFRDYFQPEALCLIEWPERAGSLLSQADLQLALEVKGSGRRLAMRAQTEAGNNIIDQFRGGH